MKFEYKPMIKKAMSEDNKKRLRQYTKVRCAKCNSLKSYMNPIARCYECGQKFCFEHIWGGQVNKKMKKDEEVRNICDDCHLSLNYQSL